MISYFVTYTLNCIVNHACIFVLKIIFMYIIPFCYVCNVFLRITGMFCMRRIQGHNPATFNASGESTERDQIMDNRPFAIVYC